MFTNSLKPSVSLHYAFDSCGTIFIWAHGYVIVYWDIKWHSKLLFSFQVLYLKLNLLTWRWHQNYMFCMNKFQEHRVHNEWVCIQNAYYQSNAWAGVQVCYWNVRQKFMELNYRKYFVPSENMFANRRNGWWWQHRSNWQPKLINETTRNRYA